MARLTATTIATTAAFAVLGLIATAVLAIVLLNLTTPLQLPIYHALYLSLGPTAATHAALVGQFTVAATIASILPPLTVAYVLDDGADGVHKIAPDIAGALALFVIFGLAFGLRRLSLPIGIVVFGFLYLAIPVLLYYRTDVYSPALPTLGGAVPVILVLFLLLGFGMGWGWGYVAIATTASPATVDQASVVDFDDAPQVEADLFTENNCTATTGGEECVLQLRGYEHELQATRFLARNGVRCPYGNAPGSDKRDAGSFLAEHDGEYYRVTCSPHGD